MATAYRVRPRPLTRNTKPVRSDRYLAWIRKQPSVVSGLGPCDACHTGKHGCGQKANDLAAIPLTRKEHQAYDRDPQGFAALHGLNISGLILDLNQRYLREVLELDEVPERKPVGREDSK